MKIVIATPSYPPRVAGPSHYAKGIEEVWIEEGHSVSVISFDAYLHLPTGIRHVAYAWALFRASRSASFMVALDIFSVAVPAVLVSKSLGKKCIVRVSGDFIWEGYVERGGKEVTLREFYQDRSVWSWREKALFFISRTALRYATGLVFQNMWQQALVMREFTLLQVPSAIIRNNFPKSVLTGYGEKKVYVWAGRMIRLKNVERLKEAFAQAEERNPSIELRMYTSLTHDEVLARIEQAYVVINPSLSDMNPNIVLEGVSRGKPFICTEETGIREVTEGMGIFVDPKSVYAIRDAILSLADPHVYDQARTSIASRSVPRTYQDVARELLVFVGSV